MGKNLSLAAFLDDLLADMCGPELSWDWNLDTVSPNGAKRVFRVTIPIRLYGDRKPWVQSRVEGVADKHGLTKTDGNGFDADFCLVGEFEDVLGKCGH